MKTIFDSKPFKAFKQFSKKIAHIQTFIVLTIIYVVLVPFFALLLRIFKRNIQEKNSWSLWKLRSDTIDDIKKQF